ncbi:MAG: M16 family metallopeptidase [Pirellulaceae bacterium]
MDESTVQQQIRVHRLANGMTLLVEPMMWLESAAFSLLVPAGNMRDPRELPGLGALVCEMVERGSGNRDSRQFVEDLEMLGVDFSSGVSSAHTSLSGAMPSDNLGEALGIFADVVQRPHLPEDELEESRLSCLQEVRAIEDNLAQKMMIELRKQRYADPYGRSSQGTEDALQRMTYADVTRHVAAYYRPQHAILSVAGKVDFAAVRDRVESLFRDWAPRELSPIDELAPSPEYRHIQHDSSQTHIGISYEGVPYAHADYFQARGAVGVLSDGMSSRLFTEVREKRGLCYSVMASCHTLKDRGSVLCYAGTTTERAQETLTVMLAELRRLAEGIQPDELNRLKARIKSSLIMQQESSASRSGSLAGDWYYLGRPRTLGELSSIIDGLSCDSINRFLAAHPPSDFRIVTLGQQALEIPHAVS